MHNFKLFNKISYTYVVTMLETCMLNSTNVHYRKLIWITQEKVQRTHSSY